MGKVKVKVAWTDIACQVRAIVEDVEVAEEVELEQYEVDFVERARTEYIIAQGILERAVMAKYCKLVCSADFNIQNEVVYPGQHPRVERSE